ncbi:MAG: enoyl-CoA hydratase [Chromatiales bacterium]|jgi:enoyl-CoA hydratase|nr:enoyl-CoA hydratase [Chromatiales bacterium]
MAEGQITTTFEARGERGVVAYITIDRPNKLNALSIEQAGRLVDAFDALRRRDDLRAVVLTGAGDKAFQGGADLDQLGELTQETARRYITSVHLICAGIRACPVPVIARVNGYCIGAGMEIAASCDIRVVAASAHFSMPEVKVGLPSVVEAALLPNLIGHGHARWLVLTGDSIDVHTADRWGFVDVLAADDALDTAVERTVASIVNAAPLAVRTQKDLVNQWERLSVSDAVALGIDAFEAAYRTDEPSRYVGAFAAERAALKASLQLARAAPNP